MSLQDSRIALQNSYKVLKKGGIFRCVVPDLEYEARTYLQANANGDSLASITFMDKTLLGIKERPRNLAGLLHSFWGNAHHLWMWDSKSLTPELKNAGFTQIRNCKFNDSEDEMFKQIEEVYRFENALAIECKK